MSAILSSFIPAVARCPPKWAPSGDCRDTRAAPGPPGPTRRRITFTESELPCTLHLTPYTLQAPSAPDLAHLERDEDHQDERGGQLRPGQEGHG